MSLQDYIFEVKIPVEEVMEVKNEKRNSFRRNPMILGLQEAKAAKKAPPKGRRI